MAAASNAAAIPSWLASGVTPAGANWLSGEGDESNSRFSTLGQINSTKSRTCTSSGTSSSTPRTSSSARRVSRCAVRTTCSTRPTFRASRRWLPIRARLRGTRRAGDPAAHAARARLRVDNTRDESYSPTLNLIYAGQQDGSIVALNAKTGAPVWTTSVIGAGTYGDVTGAESAPYTQFYDIPGTDGIVLSAPNGGRAPSAGIWTPTMRRRASWPGGRGICGSDSGPLHPLMGQPG